MGNYLPFCLSVGVSTDSARVQGYKKTSNGSVCFVFAVNFSDRFSLDLLGVYFCSIVAKPGAALQQKPQPSCW